MFGLLIAGRLVRYRVLVVDKAEALSLYQVQTEFEQASETKVVFNIPNADDINHIVVFMTGQTPFPEGVGGSVYFCWPSVDGPCWYYLGYISNEKPSAIFKVSNLKTGDVDNRINPFGQLNTTPSHMAQIGISADPWDAISQLTPATKTAATTAAGFMEFSTKMLESLFNYASSFGVSQAQMTPNPSETFVPMSTLQQWFNNFQRRLEQNPNFWKS